MKLPWPFAKDGADSAEEVETLRVEATRAKALVEESPELLVVLDSDDRVIAASRRARSSLDGITQGSRVPAELLSGDGAREPVRVTYDVDGRVETILYLNPPGEPAAYQELRAGFTAAVSHELRTPLARLLALLETAALPGEDPVALADQARGEVEQIRELIDDVLFLSELESGRAVVALGATRAFPVVEEVLRRLRERADRAGVTLHAEGDQAAELPLRPRMLRVVVENLAGNAIRYAGTGSRLTISVRPGELRASDDGAGVSPDDLPRLFERFYRADRVRGAGGTGLGLAVVKHIVSAAGGRVEALGGPGQGLTIRCLFPS
jgi:two-component system, OmpR family, phosphate regulon sensor histidine kinase PhoR